MSSLEGVIVVGAGGHGKVVVATLQASNRQVVEVWDDDPELWNERVLGVPIRGPIKARASRSSDRQAVLAVGNNSIRRRLAAQLSLTWLSVVHPQAVVHSSVVLGRGTVVFAGAVVQPDTLVGSHAIINTGATIDHDCRLADYVHLAPGVNLAGEVVVEEGVLAGIGVSVLPRCTLGAWATIGAGSTVLHDVPSKATVAGVPARPMGSTS